MRFTLTLLGMLSFASPARADEPRLTTPDEPPASRLTWYGYQPIVADMSTIALTFASTAVAGGPGLGVGLGTWALATPAIHAAHGRWVVAGASLALRVLLPLVLTRGFAASCSPTLVSEAREDCAANAVWKGWMLGMGAATVIDASALSWETKPVSLTPTASLASRDFTFGMGGSF